MMKIEAIFGGILGFIVLGVAIYLVATTPFGNRGNSEPAIVTGGTPVVINDTTIAASDLICQCYDQGRELAGTGVGVMSSQYRSGFEQCRAIANVAGGDAWTAGWNARLSAKPYEASCRRYKKRGA